MEKPDPTPEGRLLRDAITREKRSIREVARRVNISEARLRNILNGYQSAGRGQYNVVVAPAERIAGLAFNLRVKPQQVRAAGRGDAADFMERMERLGDETEARLDELAEWAEHPWSSPLPQTVLDEIETEDLLKELSKRILGERGPGVLGLASSAPSGGAQQRTAQDEDAQRGQPDPE